MSDIYLNTIDNTALKEYIIDNLSSEKFKTLNNGLLEVYFRNYGKQSSLQNFLEYTLSDEYKDYKFYYELFTEKSNNLYSLSRNKISGLILIIFDITFKKNVSEPVVDVLCPYFSPSIVNYLESFNKVAFAIKKGNIFEPIYYFNGTTIPKKIFNIKTNPHIENLVKTFISQSKTVIESEIIQVARHIKKPRFEKNIISFLYLSI